MTGLKRQGISANSLRHTAAHLLLADDVDPIYASRQLRHQRFETTKFYVRKQIDMEYFDRMPV